MNKEIHPAVIAGAFVLLVVLLLVWGYRAMQPAPYLPSPGVAGQPATTTPNYGTPSATPGMPPQTTEPGRTYTQPPPNSIPGMPPGAGK